METEEIFRRIKKTAGRSIRDISNSLECFAESLEYNFPSIKVKNLPEYVRALDSLKKYGEIVIERMKELINVEGDKK